MDKLERMKRSGTQAINVNPAVKVKPVEASTGGSKFKCTCCGKEYSTQKGHFPVSNSILYKANGGFITVCRECVENYYQQMVEFYSGNEEHAVEHCCQIFDWYYCPEAMAMTKNVHDGRSRISMYPSKMNMAQIQKKGRTYLDTIKDKHSNAKILDEGDLSNTIENPEQETTVPLSTVKFFGYGYTPEDYVYLEEQYGDWTTRYECKTKAQEELFKSICMAQLNIQHAQKRGNTKEANDAMKTFQDLLGTANLKPNQTNDNALADQNTFGTLIKKWEMEKPVSDPDPEWQDVDGIKKYIETYFLGHLCNLVHVKNDYEEQYLSAMEEDTVKPPVYESEEAGDTSILERYSDRSDKDDNA